MKTILATPKIAKDAHIAEQSAIVGDVEIGSNSSVFYFAAIRADNAPIRIGERTNIQESTTIHVNTGGLVSIGNDVTIGHNAVIHGCTIKDGSMIGMGSIVMDDAVIGKNCLVAAGSLITKGKSFPDNSLIMGHPAKVVSTLSEEQLDSLKIAAERYAVKGRMLFGDYGDRKSTSNSVKEKSI